MEKLLALWIGGSVLPVSLVDNPDFKKFIAEISPEVILIYFHCIVLGLEFSKRKYCS